MSRPITKAKVRLTTAIDSSSSTIAFTALDSNRSLTSVAQSDFGTYGYLVINPSGKANNYQVTRFTSWSVSGSTITIGGLTHMTFQGDDSSATGLSFAAGTLCVVGTNHNWFNHVVRDEDAQTIAGVKTFSSFPITPSSSPTTAYQVANKQYVDGVAVAGAPNADTTTKGIVEIATTTETAAGTAAGGTGAALVPANSTFNATSSAAVLVPVTNASGKISSGFGGSASGLATLNGSTLVVENPANATATPTASKIPIADSAGQLANWSNRVSTNALTTGEAVDGSTTPQAVAIKVADGLVYKADANDTTLVKFFGFVTTNASITTTPYVITDGVVGGFSGLTVGASYYVSDTAGTISATPSTTTVIPIGIAMSATTLLIGKGRKVRTGTVSHSAAAGATENITNTIGFRYSVLTTQFVIRSRSAATFYPYNGCAQFLGTTLIWAWGFGENGSSTPTFNPSNMVSNIGLVNTLASMNPNTGANYSYATHSISSMTDTTFVSTLVNTTVGGAGGTCTADIYYTAIE